MKNINHDIGQKILNSCMTAIRKKDPSICLDKLEIYWNEGPLHRLQLSFKKIPICYIAYKYHDHPFDDTQSAPHLYIIWNVRCINWNGYMNDNYVEYDYIDFDIGDPKCFEKVVDKAIQIYDAFKLYHDTVSKLP